ncbi:transcription elongation factor SPT5 [Sporothrix brasiliensis 5110]|uniref:Transcription elongation factor SPT5 n=1 Tax=Sporothrix brasiliensis 5110 TaxID=1398154 RepID=A0A0C2IZ46_9PEZI|nr:transcription elongation factor SPT5 [Sporothrix brasiliensis 5110]KIH90232.1 transcription elongation factor SPT5 [Sporothrix brasiliensis 5110]
MSTRDLLYGGDSESDDDNFNPAPADMSDEEGDDDGDVEPKAGSSSPAPRHGSSSRRAVDDDDEDEEDSNVRRRRRQDDDDDEENDGNSVKADGDDAKADPGARRRSVDDNDNDDDDDEDEGADMREKKRSRNDDDDDEEDDEVDEEEDEEDEDEDEDDEDDVQSSRHRRKRHKRDSRAAFFDIEAEVDDEDEGEDDEKEGEEIGDFIDNAHPDDVEERGRMNDDRRHRELDRRRELEQSLDAEKQAEILRQRYGNRRPAKGLGDSAVVPRRLLLPSVEDPSIWAVRCKEGKEREVVFSIMKRIEERLGTKDELGITAAFERGGAQSVMKGYIYVEALRQTDIMTALDGMLNVYPRNNLILVEIKDMPDLFRVTKTPTLEPGAWVRLRRPLKYSGDLAQVLDVTENGLEARVRFIPRLDYGVRDEQLAAVKGANGGKAARRPPGVPGPRPPQRLFSEVEARKRGPKNIMAHAQPNTWTYNGDYFENGFLTKDVKLQMLVVKDVNPTLEEVTKFALGAEDGTENLDLKALAASLKDSNANVTYVPGDVVEVYEGEQKGVIGRAANIVGDIVTIDVTDGELRGTTIEAPTKGLRKRFRAGDHVKVIGGRFRDDVGMVVKIDEDRVTLLTDQSNTEITVFSKDLREASDTGGQGALGQYSLLDLVQLDLSTVGCIIKIDRESLVALDQNGDKRTIMPSQISNLLPKNKMAVAADRNGSEIRLDDVVKEYGGMQRQGKIIHIHRSYLFMHSNSTTEDAGVFVARASNVSTVAAKGGRVSATAGGPDLSTMNPAMKRNGQGGPGSMQAPQRVMGRDRALGQTVTIRRGGYKGLLGIVKDTTDLHARVELHTKSKIVTVPKADLIFKDKLTGRAIDINSRGGRGGAAGGFGRGGSSSRNGLPAPAWESGGRTPAAGGLGDRTPAWGMAKANMTTASSHTPAWNRNDAAGARTPAWAADGSRTVNPYDGSRTAYGSGSRTPAWNSGAKTPAYDGFGHGSKTPAWGGSGSGGGSSSDAWGSGSKTPAYGVSAPTPGASGNDSWGYTPGASGSAGAGYDAPTPGAGLSAPTPGALNAPTPGAYSAPTPGAALSAPTPGGGWAGGWGADSAPTPAAGAPTPAAGGGYYGAPTPAAYGGAPETPAASGPRYADDD